MPNKIKLFLADDLPNYRAWVHSAIALNLPPFILIGHGDSFSGIMDSIKQELPNVLILDFATGSFKIASAIKGVFLKSGYSCFPNPMQPLNDDTHRVRKILTILIYCTLQEKKIT